MGCLNDILFVNLKWLGLCHKRRFEFLGFGTREGGSGEPPRGVGVVINRFLGVV